MSSTYSFPGSTADIGEFLDVEEGFDAGEWNNVPGGPDEERERRTGVHVLQTAKSLGWKDDGEGALEFLLRRAREIAFEDCAEKPAGKP